MFVPFSVFKVYEVGREAAKGFKENMKIAFDSVLPKWNYRAIPLFLKSGSYFEPVPK